MHKAALDGSGLFSIDENYESGASCVAQAKEAAEKFANCDAKSIPQGLKPHLFQSSCGTAKQVAEKGPMSPASIDRG